MTKPVITRRAERHEKWEGLPDKVNIRVYEFEPGQFTPEAVSLGMGHRYDNAETAAADFARRHGYHLTSASFAVWIPRPGPYTAGWYWENFDGTIKIFGTAEAARLFAVRPFVAAMTGGEFEVHEVNDHGERKP